MQSRTLYNGVELPMIGYGTFQIRDSGECEQCVADALAAGYRLFDTAASYENEAAVGAALRSSGLPREEWLVTTKLWVQDASYEGARAAIETSLRKLGLDYIDLYLIHQPMGDYIGAYRAMEEAYKAGKLRAIGVCNCYPQILTDICETVDVIPAVNQVELHPFFQQENALALMKEYGVQPEAWGPFAEGNHGIFTHPVLTAIAGRHGKTTAQVILRWHLQRGIPTIPKTVRRERMEENLDVFDFALTDKEMERIAAMDIGHSEIIDHRCFCTARQLNSVKIHG